MEYRNNTSGATETQSEVIANHPNTSFPSPLTNDVIESLGYTTVKATAVPSITLPYESAVRDGIEEKDGEWVEKWKVVTATTDEKAIIDRDAAVDVRSNRENRLRETDWAAGSDLTMSDEMKTYRQDLRDVPAQAGFPHTITWPTKPS